DAAGEGDEVLGGLSGAFVRVGREGDGSAVPVPARGGGRPVGQPGQVVGAGGIRAGGGAGGAGAGEGDSLCGAGEAGACGKGRKLQVRRPAGPGQRGGDGGAAQRVLSRPGGHLRARISRGGAPAPDDGAARWANRLRRSVGGAVLRPCVVAEASGPAGAPVRVWVLQRLSAVFPDDRGGERGG